MINFIILISYNLRFLHILCIIFIIHFRVIYIIGKYLNQITVSIFKIFNIGGVGWLCAWSTD